MSSTYRPTIGSINRKANTVTLPGSLRSFSTLKRIMARLRSPRGCPWDRQQTHSSLKPNLLEESYEVLQAIDEQEPAKLREELGDLLMQIVLHAQIASETKQFDISDVIQGISSKLVRRHPHIFGETKVKDAAEVALNWEALKEEERAEGESLLSSVPKEMPALAYSQSIQRRAAAVGFDWPDIEGVLDKLVEEVDEVREAPDVEERAKEFGDLLFTLVNIGRRLDIDTEAALRAANQRFVKRFKYVEEACRKRGVSPSSLSLSELDALWEEAKKKVS